MNTVEIGDKFESKSLDIIKKLIEEEQLGHLSKCIRIFQKKGYYSSRRKKNIVFDLTIEVWPPGATRYLMIYIIECKDYDKRVPVSKVEDFHSKIQQVSGVNVKGIFISNSPLQDGAYNFAESVGMMVIQGESSDSYKIVLHKKSSQIDPSSVPFISATYDNSLLDEGVEHVARLIDKKIINSFISISENYVSYNIDKLSKENIEKIANEELRKIKPEVLEEGYTLNRENLLQYINDKLGVIFVNIPKENTSLGFCDIKNNTIAVNASINKTSRELFILSHEIGHYILHQKLSIGQMLYDVFEDSEYNFNTNRHDLMNPKQWVEWQANYFAISLIIPRPVLLVRLQKCQNQIGLRKGGIYLDDQYQNQKDFSELVKRLAYQFNTSKTSIIYRLKEMNLINDRSRLKSLRDIIFEYKDDFFA